MVRVFCLVFTVPCCGRVATVLCRCSWADSWFSPVPFPTLPTGIPRYEVVAEGRAGSPLPPAPPLIRQHDAWQGHVGQRPGCTAVSFCYCLDSQFVCMECLVTASMDMFPQQLRKSGRRELLILAVAVVCYSIGLFLVTEVRGQWGFLPFAQGLHPPLPTHGEAEGPTHWNLSAGDGSHTQMP